MSDHNDSSPATISPYRSPPGIPKPPFDPPRRRSSLAFSQLLTAPPTRSAAEEDVRTPNVGRKRTHATPFMRPAATPGHTSRIQQIFQDATAMMQLDVAYASSPAGSVDSRISPSSASVPGHTLSPVSPDVINWRYSSAPQRLAEAESDVREPFPAFEPPSSGYLPPLPDSSSPGTQTPSCEGAPQKSDSQIDANICRASSTELDGPLSELIISHIPTEPCSYYDLTMLEESPDPISGPIPDLDIFCSPAARAAADSAKLKRGLNSPIQGHTLEDTDYGLHCPDLSVHQNIPQSNVLVSGPRCPDPSVHRSILHPNMLAIPRQYPYSRANSRGSPLPTPKTRIPSSSHKYRSPPLNGYRMLPVRSRPLGQPYFTSLPPVEHFQPGWSKFPAEDARPGAYSFSTEAARITGSSTAPDSRIRDSYRTDTLTPLAKPQTRYRKTGIAAMTRGTGRFYGTQAMIRSMPVQFGSSPPLRVPGVPKKRARESATRSLDDVLIEQNEEVVRELSPDVTPYRKGSEPKKVRRISYWDKDILGPENKENAWCDQAADAISHEAAIENMETLLDKKSEQVLH